MEKMSKIAKNLGILLNVAYQVCRAAVCVLLVCMIVLPFAGASMIEGGSFSLELGCVNLIMANSVVSAENMVLRVELGMAYTAAVLTVVCYLLKLVRGVVKAMEEKRPFDGTVSAQLRKLSLAALIGGGVLSAAKLAGEMALSATYDFSTLFLNEKIVAVQTEYALDMNFILAFAVLYLLSFVFRYGEELQRQSDETL